MIAAVSGPPLQHAWWLASRAAGLVAMGLVSTSVLLGLSMASATLRRLRPVRQLLAMHEQVALASLVAMAVHAVTLLGDPWLKPGIAGVTVPFSMSYRTPFTGLGMLAAYLAALLGLSFYVRRHVGMRLWRRLHRLTLVVYALAIVHALGAGTDAREPWMIAVLAAPALPLALLVAERYRARGLRRRPVTAAGVGAAR